MIKAEIVVDFPKWKTKIKNPHLYFKKKIKKLSSVKSLKKKNFQFTLLLTNKIIIKKLNKKFRKKNKETDVLSFPFHTKKEFKNKIKTKQDLYLGDIIINLDRVKDKKIIKNFKKEFDRLWIHGLAHLFGHDHKKDKDFRKMQQIEKRYFELVND